MCLCVGVFSACVAVLAVVAVVPTYLAKRAAMEPPSNTQASRGRGQNPRLPRAGWMRLPPGVEVTSLPREGREVWENRYREAARSHRIDIPPAPPPFPGFEISPPPPPQSDLASGPPLGLRAQ